ncbi:P-loop containing nucleoside triphosphate hydrolase protein [Zopfochytrium polystomum]|nr:P-loop containing nucleoside triphosphate hydrolase protein [Zopfochytrium polystomum]
MSRSIFQETLRKASLDQYHDSFAAFGIDSLQSLVLLTMQDYSIVGVSSVDDKKRFQLIQHLKSESDLGSMAAPPAFTREPSNKQPSMSFLPKPSFIPSSIPKPLSSSSLSGDAATVPVAAASYSSAYLDRPLRHSSSVDDTGHMSKLETQPKERDLHHIREKTSLSQLVTPASRSSSPPPMHAIPAPTIAQNPHQLNPRIAATTSAAALEFHSRPATAAAILAPSAAPSSTAATAAGAAHELSSDSDSDNPDPTKVHRRKIAQQFGSPQKKGPNNNSLLNAYGLPISQTGSRVKAAPAATAAAVAAVSTAPAAPMMGLSDRIRVCVRKRPLSKKELKSNQIDIAIVNGRYSLTIHEPKVKVDLTKYVEQHEFIFDEVFDCDASNEEVYKRTAFPLVEYIFSGGKATCFAYGQTGSGKTYTMLDEKNGLYVLAGRDIFAMLEKPEYSHLTAFVGFYEIYQSHLYDLLNNRKRLFAREDGKQQVCIVGLKEYQADNVETLMEIFDFGHNARSTGATGANADSSRSHAIFQIVLKHKRSKKKTQGKLSFIDLAGSERGADRGDSDKQTRMEGSEINKSLLALKECIRALDLDSKHTPFRQSKLTQVLKDSFIGNSKTCMVATVSPNNGNSEHTLNTLRYAYRVKEIKGESQPRGDTASISEEKDATLSNPRVQATPTLPRLASGEDNFLLDSEFPPDNIENLILSDDEEPFYEESADDGSGSPSDLSSPEDTPPFQEKAKQGFLAAHLMANSSPTRPSGIRPPLQQLQQQQQHPPQPLQPLQPLQAPAQLSVPVTVAPSPAPPPSMVPKPVPREDLSLAKTGSLRLRAEKVPPPVLADLSPPSPLLDAVLGVNLDDLVAMHRRHARELVALSKMDNQLIFSASMKPAGGGQARSMDDYIDELEDLLEQKMKSILELKGFIESVQAERKK